MKRGGFLKRRTPLKSYTPLKKSPLRRGGGLRKVSKNPISQVKKRIQALIRQRVIERDGGCILRHYPQAGRCNEILQAEHLVTRANSISYADLRNIVCLCQRHHIFWKPQYSRLYWELVEKHVGKKRWEYVRRTEADKSPHRMTLYDWLEIEKKL